MESGGEEERKRRWMNFSGPTSCINIKGCYKNKTVKDLNI